MGERLIHELLEKQTYWRPEKTALVFEDTEYSYTELDQRVNRLATSLHEYGIGPGDHLLAHGFNHVDWYTLFFACSKLGAIFCPVSKYQSQRNLEYITAELSPEFVFYTDDETIVDERLPTIRAESPDAVFLSLDHRTDDESIEAFMDSYSGTRSAWQADVTPDRIHNILWTSGTTGKPKAVLRDHRASLHCSDNLINDLPFDEDNVRAITNPMMLFDPYFHYGLPTIMVGGTIVIPRTFSAEKLCTLVRRYDVNSLHLGFTLSRLVVEYLRENDLTINLRYMTGVIPSSNMAESLYELTDELHQIYGTTEIGLPLVKQLEPPFEAKPALGKPGLGADIRVVPLNAEPGDIPNTLPEPGDTGQLICKGVTTMTSYRDEQIQQDNVHDGWIYPGDVVRVTEQREVVFLGRSDDRLRSGGVNVYPSEVENVLEEHHQIENAIVVGVDDETWRQRICALVVTVDMSIDEQDLQQELDAHCKASDGLADGLRPKEYAFVSSSSKVPTGAQEKEDREAIKTQFFER